MTFLRELALLLLIPATQASLRLTKGLMRLTARVDPRHIIKAPR